MPSYPAQQMYGGRMQAVGNSQFFGLGRDFFGLDFCHPI